MPRGAGSLVIRTRSRVTRRRLSAVTSALAPRAELHLVSCARQPAEELDDERADRLAELGVRHLHADRAQLLHRRAPVDLPGVLGARDLDDLLRLLVELVADLADDLLEQVLHRHDAARAAVLVDDDRDGHLLALHLAHHVDAALHLGHEEHVAPEGREVRQGRRVGVEEEVLRVEVARRRRRASGRS